MSMSDETRQTELIRLRREQRKTREDEVFLGSSAAERVEHEEKEDRILEVERNPRFPLLLSQYGETLDNPCSFFFLVRKPLIQQTWWAAQDSNRRTPACEYCVHQESTLQRVLETFKYASKNEVFTSCSHLATQPYPSGQWAQFGQFL